MKEAVTSIIQEIILMSGNGDLHQDDASYFVDRIIELFPSEETIIAIMNEASYKQHIHPNGNTIYPHLAGYNFKKVAKAILEQKANFKNNERDNNKAHM